MEGHSLDLDFHTIMRFGDDVAAAGDGDVSPRRGSCRSGVGDLRLVDAHVRRVRVKIEDHPDEPTVMVTDCCLGSAWRPAERRE